MDYVAELKQLADSINSTLKFERVRSDEHDRRKRFCMKAVVDGQSFPNGVGKSKNKAKQKAAKWALRCLNVKENESPVTENAAETPAAKAHERVQIKHESLLNESGQLNKMPIRAVESPRPEPNNATQCCSFMVGDKEYSAATGKTKMEDKKEAPTLAFQNKAGSAKDVLNPEGVNTGPSDKTQPGSTQSEISSRFTQDFDSIECLGKGGFGCVFKAKQKLTGKDFAVKIVLCKENGKALREVEALSDLHHSNIVRYFSCWMEDSGYQWDSASDSCSTTQRENVQNVKKSLQNSKRREESLTIAQQIVNGVEYIHSKMLIHRDLKPANIMFGQGGEVRIGDFGLVTAENDDNGENLIERTVYKGTPSYMAPEQRSQNTYDRKVDIFAVGLIYIELLWKFPTWHEKQMAWNDIRKQKFPKGFWDNFTQEDLDLLQRQNYHPPADIKMTLEDPRMTPSDSPAVVSISCPQERSV
ncbi:Interferon-induced, double-stranded RNA-activated protein kinase [Collichthys lucidus]|uniref:Interferon-induced, double-stranded RNA-activated protein kinase n=1 Tax=Collichthys lucidus TaxID=240159 RepID=A0A4U5VBY2_COLLU|nr:Interferon-induced, double-stranded RNA-activated protein kinase [Collichthys lucidus]